MRFKILFIGLFLIFFLTACKEERTIVQDNVTAPLAIESVAESTDSNISDGNAKFSSGDFNAAIESYSKATNTNKATAFYNIGVSYYLLNNTPMAELNFREAVKADPDFDEAVMNLVAVLAEQGPEKAKEAEQYINRYIYTNKSAKVFVEIANVYLSVGDNAKAMYYYRKAIDADAKSPFVSENYANFLISMGEYQDGIELLEHLHEKNFTVYYNLANAYFSINNKDSAYGNAVEALYSDGAGETGYDKLAQLFNKLKKYQDETHTLRILVSGNPAREYRERLIRAYLTLSQNDKAIDEVNALINDFPDDEDLCLLKYNIIIFTDIQEAGKYIKQIYNRFKTDKTLSYYAKHVCYFEKSQGEIRHLISNNRTNGWMALAKAVYALKQGSYGSAAEYLKDASAANGHDYFAYNSFLAIKNNDFAKASEYAQNLDLLQYDTFWYKLVIAWNMRQPQAVTALGEEYKNSSLISIRPPSFEFNIRPVLDDMSFTYRFDDKSVDAASMLSYPVFLQPDETVQFLITGRSALNDRDRGSVQDKLVGIKLNNAALESFSSFNFEDALDKFLQASDYLPNNIAVYYNIALTYFNLGDNDKAVEMIGRSLLLDKNNPYINFISGLVNYRMGNYPAAKLNFDQAKINIAKNIGEHVSPSDEDIRLLYLAALAGERGGRRAEAESIVKAPDNGFAATCVLLMDYFDDYDFTKLEKLENSPIFRVSRVAKLLELKHIPVDQYKDVDDPDRYYTLAHKFVMLHRGAADAVSFNNRFAKDKVYLKDMVYVAVFQGNKKDGLQYLQTLSNMDYRYSELYKVSLYYFTWARDFVNAEASYGSLDRMGYKDQTTFYYMLLYFLSNFNESRLQTYLKLYDESYGVNYRSDLVTAMMNLYTKNIIAFDGIIKKLLISDPYLFDKMFVEVNFEKF